jgi:hypothetical protein
LLLNVKYEKLNHRQMKNLEIHIKQFLALVALSFTHLMVLAQDTASSSTVTSSSRTTTTSETWYAEPWAWALGAVVLIIIIVAITRSGGGSSSSGARGTKDKVSVTKEVTREDV